MDPNATLKSIEYRLQNRVWLDDVDQFCEDLYVWLEHLHGHEPDWSAYPLATSYYQCRVIEMKRQGK